MEVSEDMKNEEFIDAPYGLEASDDEADDHKHAKLLQAMGSLGSKKKPSILQRTEPTVKASEFNLASSAGKVNLQDLVGALNNTSTHGDVKKRLGKIHAKQKLLNTPLARNELEKIQRNVAYEGTTSELTKWDPIVRKNRKAEQLDFPLVKPNVKMRSTNQMAKGYKPRTPLEIEVAKVLAGSKSVAPMNQELTPAEEQALQAMSIEEAKERRAELQKYRALLTYKEAKARRQKKIKSKRFHRILRKERQKIEKKELETLQEKDPEAYADMLMKLHKDRIQERISLKHRGGSKFMKRQAIYGKYDDKSRQAVADMLEKHKELSVKMNQEGSSEDEDEDTEKNTELELRVTPSGQPVTEDSNPWMSIHEPNIGARTYRRLPEIKNKEVEKAEMETEDDEEMEVEDEEKSDDELANNINLGIDDIFNEAARRVKMRAVDALAKEKEEAERAEELRKKRLELKRARRVKRRIMHDSDNDSSDSESELEEETEKSGGTALTGQPDEADEEETGIESSLTRKQTLEDFEGLSDNENATTNVLPTPQSKNSEAKKKVPQVDPKNFLTISTQVKSSLAPELIADSGEVEEEAEDQQRLTIAQAFASDDVVEEFKLDKAATVEKDKPKDIDLTLPGWGEWGGTGIQTSKRKRKRFMIKAPPAAPRKDSNLTGVIISESKDNSIAKHQVKNLPFPFTNVHQFESSVRAPIGKTWNPENAYRNLIKPKIATKMGTVIDPIDKGHTFKKENNQLPNNNRPERPPTAKKIRKGGNQQKKKKS